MKKFFNWIGSKLNGKTAAISAAMAAMSTTAYADEPAGPFDSVVSSMDTLGTLMTKVWTLMTSNPLLVLFLAVSLLSIGVAVFRMIKRAARR